MGWRSWLRSVSANSKHSNSHIYTSTKSDNHAHHMLVAITCFALLLLLAFLLSGGVASPCMYALMAPALFIAAARSVWNRLPTRVASSLTILLLIVCAFSFLFGVKTLLDVKRQGERRRMYDHYQSQCMPSTLQVLNLAAKEYNIFFVETNEERTVFSAKQMCAIESAARNNPRARVNVLSIRATFPDDFQRRQHADLFSNIRLLKFTPTELFNDTPLWRWWQSGVIFSSPYYHSHMSDAVRFT